MRCRAAQEVIQAALKEVAIADWDAGDGLICEAYVEVAARRIVEELASAGWLKAIGE